MHTTGVRSGVVLQNSPRDDLLRREIDYWIFLSLLGNLLTTPQARNKRTRSTIFHGDAWVRAWLRRAFVLQRVPAWFVVIEAGRAQDQVDGWNMLVYREPTGQVAKRVVVADDLNFFGHASMAFATEQIGEVVLPVVKPWVAPWSNIMLAIRKRRTISTITKVRRVTTVGNETTVGERGTGADNFETTVAVQRGGAGRAGRVEEMEW